VRTGPRVPALPAVVDVCSGDPDLTRRDASAPPARPRGPPAHDAPGTVSPHEARCARGAPHDFEFSLVGGVIFGVHELGHLVFAPFGEFLSVAGGSIAQIALPAAAALLFLKRQDRYAIAVCGCWLAVSLGQLGVYVADARAESLDLVSFSAEGAVHDWNYLLERMHLLRDDVQLGHFAKFVGWLVLGFSLLLGLDALRARGATRGPDAA
jgi:hypothetical protein